MINVIADRLVERSDEIIRVNQTDLDAVRRAGITGPLFDRLAITESKIRSLSDGLKQIAENSFDNVGRVIRRTKVSDTLDLEQRTVPIGVLMVIFESRPGKINIKAWNTFYSSLVFL